MDFNLFVHRRHQTPSTAKPFEPPPHLARAAHSQPARAVAAAARQLLNRSFFSVTRQDITALKVDAIVNVANKNLECSAGVNGAIHAAVGLRPEGNSKSILQNTTKKAYPNGCRPGHAVMVTVANPDLNFQHVIHAVGPDCSNPNEHMLRCRYLSSACTEAVHLAEDAKLQSIAIAGLTEDARLQNTPPSTRAKDAKLQNTALPMLNEFSSKEALQTIVTATHKALQNCSTLNKVHFVALDDEMENHFNAALDDLFKNPTTKQPAPHKTAGAQSNEHAADVKKPQRHFHASILKSPATPQASDKTSASIHAPKAVRSLLDDDSAATLKTTNLSHSKSTNKTSPEKSSPSLAKASTVNAENSTELSLRIRNALNHKPQFRLLYTPRYYAILNSIQPGASAGIPADHKNKKYVLDLAKWVNKGNTPREKTQREELQYKIINWLTTPDDKRPELNLQHLSPKDRPPLPAIDGNYTVHYQSDTPGEFRTRMSI